MCKAHCDRCRQPTKTSNLHGYVGIYRGKMYNFFCPACIKTLKDEGKLDVLEFKTELLRSSTAVMLKELNQPKGGKK